jgi:hypothetical protein
MVTNTNNPIRIAAAISPVVHFSFMFYTLQFSRVVLLYKYVIAVNPQLSCFHKSILGIAVNRLIVLKSSPYEIIAFI